MNGAHVHLILNHIPVVLAPAGLVILAWGQLRRNAEIVTVGLAVVLAAALFTVPTYLTGDGAADIVGRLPGVSADAIERHDAVASQAFAVVGLAGLAALILLARTASGMTMPGWLLATALVLSMAASIWLGVTANLGGQIRHTEAAAPAPTASAAP